jgi:hypothetical protein
VNLRYRPLAVVPAVLALALAAGCAPGGSDTPTDAGPTVTDPPTAVETTPAATTPAPAPTAPTLTTPQAAAEHLYTAWQAGDRATALLAASDAAVDEIFTMAWTADTYFFGGCTEPTAPSECDYNWSGGIIAMMIEGDATAGFRVVSVSAGSAG